MRFGAAEPNRVLAKRKTSLIFLEFYQRAENEPVGTVAPASPCNTDETTTRTLHNTHPVHPPTGHKYIPDTW